MNKLSTLGSSVALAFSLQACSPSGENRPDIEFKFAPIPFLVKKKTCENLSIPETVEQGRQECYFSPELAHWNP